MQSNRIQEMKSAQAKQKEIGEKQVVKMKFKENQYKHPRDTTPWFEAGKVYEIRGAASIQFWIVRGGEIVEGELKFPEAVQNPSVVVPNKYTEQKPFDGDVDNKEGQVDADPKPDAKPENIVKPQQEDGRPEALPVSGKQSKNKDSKTNK